MNDRFASLDELGVRFLTDKSSEHHNYLTFYERFFSEYRDKPVTILEIGVFRGHSLKLWEEYFHNARIIGVDIDPLSVKYATPRVTIEIADQSNLEDLVRLAVKHGPFDIIIDDGSHKWEHQITALRTLFPFVQGGGLYVVEDLHTNYGPLAATYRGVAAISCVEYLKKLVDLRVADDQIDIVEEEDAFLRTFGRAIDLISFTKRACLIAKSCQENAWRPPSDRPFGEIDDSTADVPLVLLTHLGAEGDKTSDTGWVYSTGRNRNIQGFRLDRRDQKTGDVLYRARLANREWTSWVGLGEFVGTRGMGENLTGLSVRLADAKRGEFTLTYAGAFRGDPGNVVVGDGEDCIARSGNGVLFGMRVALRGS